MVQHGLRVAGLLGIGATAVASRSTEAEALLGSKWLSESIAVAALVVGLILFLRFLKWERERQDAAEEARAKREVERDREARQAFAGDLRAVLETHSSRERAWIEHLERNTKTIQMLVRAVGRIGGNTQDV